LYDETLSSPQKLVFPGRRKQLRIALTVSEEAAEEEGFICEGTIIAGQIAEFTHCTLIDDR